MKNPALYSAALFLLLSIAPTAPGQEPARPQATPETVSFYSMRTKRVVRPSFPEFLSTTATAIL